MVSLEVDDYAIELGGYRYGFVQTTTSGSWNSSFTHAELGPLGRHSVPFSAKAGVALSVASLVLIVGLVALALKQLAKRLAKS